MQVETKPMQHECRRRRLGTRSDGRPRPLAGFVFEDGGAAALEFVLVASILFTLLFGILEFGSMMNLKILVTTAAREAARRAAVDGGASQAAVSRAMDCVRMGGGVNPDDVEISIRPATAAYGSTITVRVSCAYKPVTPVVDRIAGGPVTLAAEVVTRSEKVR